MESLTLRHIGSVEDANIQQTFENPSQRNTYLPHEILSSAFILCAHDHHSKHSGRPMKTAPTWINVSYVCRYWRNVALGCPTLWTYMFMTSQRWTEELLARSDKASLKICVRLLYIPDASLWMVSLDKVMEHMERIQQLQLELPSSFATQIFPKLCSHAPRLQSLEVLIEPGFSSSLVLFDGDTPSLRSLKLSGCAMSGSLFKLQAIEILDLRCVTLQVLQTLDDFLATLNSMPNLRELYVDRSLTSATGFLSNTGINSSKKINLPHLSRLLIVAPLPTVIALLSCVNTPTTIQIRLKCSPSRLSSLDGYSLLSWVLTQRFMVSADLVPPSLAIHSFTVDSSPGNTTLTFSASKRDHDFFFSIYCDEWDYDIPLKIDIPWNPLWRTADRQRIINDICCAMPLTNVRSTHLIGSPSSPTFWRQTLGALRDLRCIKLTRGTIPARLISELSVTDHEGTKDPVGLHECHVFAPHLEELKLQRITFSPSHSVRGPAQPVATRDDLIRALSTRRHPHGRLTATFCNIGDSNRFDLVATWGDGEVRIISEDDSDLTAFESEED